MKNKKTLYTVLDHTADLQVSITGSSMIDLFENAGYTLIDLMIKNIQREKTKTLKTEISAIDTQDLMVRWLSEILYLFEGENLIVTGINIVSLTTEQLKSHLTVICFNKNIHEILMEIKAVTYHQIEVIENNGVWNAKVTFDL